MAASAARAAAFDILMRVAREDSYAAELLHSDATSRLSSADAGLATQIVMGVLRWQARLDQWLMPLVGGEARMRKLDTEVLTALRMGVFQMRYLERVPSRAAVNESVELVKRARKRSAAPLVNAVLRKAASAESVAEEPASGAAGIAAEFSHPLWLVERWVKAFGEERARRICAYDQQPPQTHLRLDPAASAEAVEDSLRSEGIEVEPGKLLAGARRVTAGNVPRSEAFRAGAVALQDEGSQLVAALVGRGERILDCCAAPGGKTAAMLERSPQATVLAAEIHPQRARLMQQLLQSPRLAIIAADARHLPITGSFDRVLADVPCSGTGTLARNPEIKWKLSPADLIDLAGRQRAILSAALDRLSPGGMLVYSTCSLEEEENQQVVAAVLQEKEGFASVECAGLLAAIDDLAWNDIAGITAGPFLQTLPGVNPCDGFFAAAIRRKED